MKKSAFRRGSRFAAAAAVITGAVTLAPGLSSPASAEVCAASWKDTAVKIANSAQFRTASGSRYDCLNVKARYMDTDADYVRGQYYSPSAGWTYSGQGWKLIAVYTDSNAKVIVNVVDNTLVRGQTQTWRQDVMFSY